MPPQSWTGRATFFYPKLIYNAASPVTINFVNPCHIVDPPTELSVRGENVSLSGFREVLHIRDETRVHLLFPMLFKDEADLLRTYWHDWGKLGKQAELTLDRDATAGGQYEYDTFNTFFDRAELLTNPFEPKRRVIGDIVYLWDLVFRQGADEAT